MTLRIGKFTRRGKSRWRTPRKTKPDLDFEEREMKKNVMLTPLVNALVNGGRHRQMCEKSVERRAA